VYQFQQKGIKERITITYFFDGCDVFRQTDSVIEAKSFVVLNVVEHLSKAEIHKYCIFFYFETIDLQKDVSFVTFLAVFLILHY
jgi:hypothetical protein